MKPERNSLRIYGITRSKGKMYELGVPEESHIALPKGSEPEKLFPLTIGTLGDFAAEISSLGESENTNGAVIPEELGGCK